MKKFLLTAMIILSIATLLFFVNMKNAYCDFDAITAPTDTVEEACEPEFTMKAAETTTKTSDPTTQPTTKQTVAQTTAPTTVSTTAPTTVSTTVPTTVKQEPTTVKQEPTTVKQEPTTVKQEPTTAKQEPTTVKQEPVTVKQEPVAVKEEPTTKKPVETTTACQHATTRTETKEATCQSKGYVRQYCSNCGECLSSNDTEKTDHNFGSWQVDWYATPEYSGQESRTCSWCDYTETRAIEWKASSDSLYIPAADINATYHVGAIDQYNTDHYDVVCNRDCFGENDVVFFGHATRSLGHLRRCSVGDKVYYTENGITYTYVVTVSELAYLTYENAVYFTQNIKGYDTGAFCMYYASVPTLHMFTCAPVAQNLDARWIVIAERVA